MISQISETRQPFVRRHNQSCVYYGIRGNARSQYAFDKSCILEGAGALGITAIEPTGALFNGGALGITTIEPTGALAGLGVGVMPVIMGQMPTLLGDPRVTLLGRGGMPSLLGDANLDVLSGFFKQLIDNPKATFYVSKGSGTGGGSVNDIEFIVISTQQLEDINRAMSAAGRAAITSSALSTDESFIPDVGGRLGPAALLTPIVQAGTTALQGRIATGSAAAPVATGAMTTKAKVLLGLGAAAVIAGVATIALSKSMTNHELRGPARRRRRRR